MAAGGGWLSYLYTGHSLARKTDGSLWAWGSNAYGQLGDGTRTDRLSPIQVLTGVTAMAGGGYQTLALKTDGILWAWGGNDYGQLGDGTTMDRVSPVQVLTGVAAVAGGGTHTLARKTDGSLWAWGDNRYGQLGDGTTADRLTPVQVYGFDVSGPYWDVDPTSWAAGYINAIHDAGITGGCGNGNYCPQGLVTREQNGRLPGAGRRGRTCCQLLRQFLLF